MNANDNTSREPQADVIELGVASVETHGIGVGLEGTGQAPSYGISEE